MRQYFEFFAYHMIFYSIGGLMMILVVMPFKTLRTVCINLQFVKPNMAMIY